VGKSLLTYLQLTYFTSVKDMVEKELKGVPAPAHIAAIITDVAVKSNLPRGVKAYIIPDKALNAFAIGDPSDPGGRRGAVVAITQGLLESLSESELRGVIAHECGHLYHSDTTVNLHLMAMLTGFFSTLELGYNLLGASQKDQKRVEELKEAIVRREEALKLSRQSAERDTNYQELKLELKKKEDDVLLAQTTGTVLMVAGGAAALLGTILF
jgi:Zn-dependent protease with chaperone function